MSEINKCFEWGGLHFLPYSQPLASSNEKSEIFLKKTQNKTRKPAHETSFVGSEAQDRTSLWF